MLLTSIAYTNNQSGSAGWQQRIEQLTLGILLCLLTIVLVDNEGYHLGTPLALKLLYNQREYLAMISSCRFGNNKALD